MVEKIIDAVKAILSFILGYKIRDYEQIKSDSEAVNVKNEVIKKVNTDSTYRDKLYKLFDNTKRKLL